jgi:DnaJ-class molecular chaperone
MNFDPNDLDEIFKQAFGGQNLNDIFAQAFGAHMGQRMGGRGRGGGNPMEDILG